MQMREWVARRIMPMSYRKVEAFLRDKAVPENLKDIISSLVLR